MNHGRQRENGENEGAGGGEGRDRQGEGGGGGGGEVQGRSQEGLVLQSRSSDGSEHSPGLEVRNIKVQLSSREDQGPPDTRRASFQVRVSRCSRSLHDFVSEVTASSRGETWTTRPIGSPSL